jgi:replication factor C subunit 2/4|mmetsp:Transcript_2008/g.7484  ORF Transcript_2008/g.7484 Transcript_2008/m.7484 type:complete len:344 (-) Transcript_2008:63-1094(-)
MVNAEMGDAKTDLRHANAPWVDKYRPRVVSDISSQKEVVQVLQSALESGNMPHCLFYGPPGTGKTTAALAICKQLYGPDLYKTRVKELNASDERGISVVRNKIKNFAGLAVGAPAPGYPSPPYKILILDEADAMTNDAQSALRRMMETYSRVTRFFLLCNYVTKIIDPIASRCSKFRFKPLEPDTMVGRLQYISEQEGLEVSEDTFAACTKHSGGDMRKAITLLQSAARLFANKVSGASIAEVAGYISEERITKLYDLCRGGKYDEAQAHMEDILRDGFTALTIMDQFSDVVLTADIPDAVKAEIFIKMGQADKSLAQGADEGLQLALIVSTAVQAMAKAPSA